MRRVQRAWRPPPFKTAATSYGSTESLDGEVDTLGD